MAYRAMSRAQAEGLCAGARSDPDAQYCEVIEIDAAAIRPMIALPGDPGNGRAIEHSERVRVDIAYGGACTAGKKADMDMYARVREQAAARGERRAPWVRVDLRWSAQCVESYCAEQGYL